MMHSVIIITIPVCALVFCVFKICSRCLSVCINQLEAWWTTCFSFWSYSAQKSQTENSMLVPLLYCTCSFTH